MYSYLYDQFLSQEQYFRILSSIETILTDLGINGKIFRLTVLNTAQEIIEDEIKRGVKNIIVVGNDRLVGKVIDTLALHPEVALGIIPIGQPQEIAKTFGVPEAPAACKILATRLIRPVSLAKVNDRYFIYQAEIKSSDVIIRCDDKFQIVPETPSVIKIFNSPSPSSPGLQTIIEPLPSGLLRKTSTRSVFNSRKVFIEPGEPRGKKPVQIIADDLKKLVAPALIEITNLKLKVIVGKSPINS